ncbi:MULTISPECIES: DUF3127 domain-containing protein [unclassified Bacteroides]|jgi:hypothetical protein|uniref:DUF3127 domain-containing protein n=1 Tax=unclassified Bacteroides TaxID=2646097 RepID=UPI000E876F0D|nr:MULTISPECIES: DUF3127 domain-containing protein [unclassified Bacteroides]RGN50938.1 DUF3127 domain-containing protein [Bacteroides sp. OM05-12]RHR76626.1 DUF3127 domain-containing protein [Bacteroides sp. AF16-49]
MEFSGKIIAVLPLQTGMGRNGEWKKQEYVIETHDQYPKKMCFNLWGDKIDQFAIQAGEEMTVSFDIDCREYNGRWYNDIRAWKVERGQGAPMDASAAPMASMAPTGAPADFSATDEKDDLPF